MNEAPENTAVAEHRYHTYVGHHIPFYVRLMWVGFYCLAIWYVVQYLFPSIQAEFQPTEVPQPAAAAPSE